MIYKEVIGTVRELNGSIRLLVARDLYIGHPLQYSILSLKPYADRGLLVSKCNKTGRFVRVRIFKSVFLNRWIATTNANDTVCDNLLSKPVFQGSDRSSWSLPG